MGVKVSTVSEDKILESRGVLNIKDQSPIMSLRSSQSFGMKKVFLAGCVHTGSIHMT